MAFCPKCGSEYRAGFKICSECQVELVDELNNLDSTDEETVDAVYVHNSAFFDDNNESDKTNTSNDNSLDTANEYNQSDDDGEYLADNAIKKGYSHKYVYQNSAERSSEMSSSGYVLLIVGILGLAFILGVDFDILPFKFGNMILMNIIMITLFAVFIIFGIISLKSAKKLSAEVNKENDLTNEIKSYILTNYTRELIDKESISDSDIQDELKYFERTAFIKKIIEQKFLNLSEDFLDDQIDKLYQELYKDEWI